MEYGYPKGHVFYRKLGRTYPMVTHGDGIYLYDQNGKQYIDGSGGAIVVNVGHGQREILQKMTEQMGQIAYVHGTQFTTMAVEEYAEALGEILPSGLGKIYFLSGGSEAVEAAVKLARQFYLESGQSQRWRVVARWHSYHGNTLGALSLTGRIGMRRPYLPLLIDFPHFPPPYCYRCPFGSTYPRCELECAKALENVIQMEGPETISGVILEPIIGATVGAVVPPDEYFPLIQGICNRYGILCIDDEIMTGMGRTGKWFAVDHWNAVPDIMILGKGMSGGYFPLSAVTTRNDLVDRLKEKTGGFVHGHTFSHHSVACAVGLAVLQFINEHHLVDRSRQRGIYLLKRLEELKEFTFVGDVRGKGLMTAIEFVKDQKTREPFPRSDRFTEKVIDIALENGLVLYPGTGFVDGMNGDMVMVAPPFVIEESQIDEIMDSLRKTFSKMNSKFRGS
ncbi:MAG TPA: aminotransferase class III-fold pyridoxal phosphate-dependent enzyme [Thermodesulfobacteriota bacterium]|nr:aminotransferase class III-fold pyridoxal phosphate-dependent enzyme [Thermodesulfobacteriota bacterium]